MHFYRLDEPFSKSNPYLDGAAYNQELRSRISSFLGRPESIDDVPWAKDVWGGAKKFLKNKPGFGLGGNDEADDD